MVISETVITQTIRIITPSQVLTVRWLVHTTEDGSTERRMRASMVDMAATIVGASRDVSAADVVKMALSTSDFPNILTNVGNKVIADSFETADTTYQIWTNARDIKDFKVNSSVELGGFGNYQTKTGLAKAQYESLTGGIS